MPSTVTRSTYPVVVGTQTFKAISGAGTTATSVKPIQGTLYGFAVSNSSTSVRYLKFYDKATAPTVGVDTPLQVYMVPATYVYYVVLPFGTWFNNGIAIAITTGAADSDTGATGANEVIVNIFYK